MKMPAGKLGGGVLKSFEPYRDSDSENGEGEVMRDDVVEGCPRQSPSQRSQDSGFSDSGDSGGGHSPDIQEEGKTSRSRLRENPFKRHQSRVFYESEFPVSSGRVVKLQSDDWIDLSHCELELKTLSEEQHSTPKKTVNFRFTKCAGTLLHGPSPVQKGILKKQMREFRSRRWSSVQLRDAPEWVRRVPEYDGFHSLNSTSSLPRNFPRSKSNAASSCLFSSVASWMLELRGSGEAECMSVLQGKSLEGDVRLSPLTCASRALRDLRLIQAASHSVSGEFVKLCKTMENQDLAHIPPLVQSLVGNIFSFLDGYPPAPPSRHPFERKLRVLCGELRGRADFGSHMGSHFRDLVQILAAVGHTFTRLVDCLLMDQVKVLMRCVCGCEWVGALGAVLSRVTSAGLLGPPICRMVAETGGVRTLLSIALEPRARVARSYALRALATLGCVTEAIRELEQAGGVEILADILCDEETREHEKKEAAGVLAQITSPWIEENHQLHGLAQHLIPTVKALTDLAENGSCEESFLLASAALANLTFVIPEAVSHMHTFRTAHVLIHHAQTSQLSVFAQDQIATVLANMAANPESRRPVSSEGGLVVLLSFLDAHSPPPTFPPPRDPEIAASERVQQKAAIAISRLCVDQAVGGRVIALGGVKKLVNLCRNEQCRHQSDAVLIACLAALRKIATLCGTEEVKQQNALDLVEPRLLDSFLLYSSQQESYV